MKRDIYLNLYDTEFLQWNFYPLYYQAPKVNRGVLVVYGTALRNLSLQTRNVCTKYCTMVRRQKCRGGAGKDV